MLNIKKELKELYESGQDIYTFEHSLVFKNTDSGEITVVNDNIKKITNDFKIDGTPIGKFPIEIIEFEIGGDYTEKFKMDNSYEVHIIDKYVSPTINDEITSKTFVITEMEYSRENRSTSFKGYDYGSKLSVEYDDTKYKLPLTLGQFATEFFSEYGLEIENINDMFQKDYQLKVIPTYDTGVMGIQVARDIAKMSMSIIYVGQNNKVKIIDPTKLVDKNLIKSDFSDFYPYGGAIITKNKTFPIDVFKGGRNCLLRSKELINPENSGVTTFNMSNPIPKGEITISIKELEIVKNVNGETRFLILLYSATDSMDYVFFNIEDEKLEKTITIADDLTRINFYSGQSYFVSIPNEFILHEVKITQGNNPNEPYSPAPEDGYGYTGSDGAWHIQSSGGTSSIKFLKQLSISENNVNYIAGLKVKSFNDDLSIYHNINTTPIYDVPKNETISYERVVVGNGTSQLQFQFINQKIDTDLDFIASNPNMFVDTNIGSIDTYKSFKSNQDMFKTMGINRLVLGLSGDIDGENVSKSDSSMIAVDGDVELRLDSIPFVFDQALKQEVIDNMFNHIKGFKYRAFESESKFFFYEIGDYIKQVGNDEVGGDYNILLAQQTIVRNGSTMTTHSAESGSVNETQMNWENYTPSKHSEIMINKALQEIQLINSNYNGIKDQVAQLDIKLDEINASVSSMGGNNAIYGLNLENDFIDWKTTSSNGLLMGDKKRLYDGLMFGMGSVIEEVQSLSGRALVALYDGNMITPKGRIIPDSKYSYRGRRWSGTQKFSITVIEYNQALSVLKRTKFDFDSPKEYESFTIQPNNSTMWVELEFTFVNVTPSNPLKLTDQMFARGEPKAYVENVGDLKSWAQAQIKIVDNQIDLQAQEIDNVYGDIHNSGVEINAVDGITTYGKSFNVMNSSKTKTLLSVVNINGEESLDININNGNVGNFSLDEGKLVYETNFKEREYTYADLNEMNRIKNLGSATPYQLYIYDLDNTGSVTLADIIKVSKYLNGEGEKPIRLVKSKIVIGTSGGEIRTSTIYGDNLIGSEFYMVGERISGTLGDFSGINVDVMSIGGKEIYIDSDNFLKLKS